MTTLTLVLVTITAINVIERMLAYRSDWADLSYTMPSPDACDESPNDPSADTHASYCPCSPDAC
jgi:hypothetical protein